MNMKQANIIVRIVTLKDRLIATTNPLREESCRNEIIRMSEILKREKQKEAAEIAMLATPCALERAESVYG